MRFGIVADIHEAIDPLRRALALFRDHGVDQVVNLGDACDIYGATSRAGEVADLLREAGAVGVWGNHDAGLCHEIPDRIATTANPALLEYMATMQPYLSMHDCRFSHVEPWIDATQTENLWCFEGPPDTPEKAVPSFAAVSEHRLFLGHYHRWLVMTPERRIDWVGEQKLSLDPGVRHLIVVGPVMSGDCGIYDTVESSLLPLRCD